MAIDTTLANRVRAALESRVPVEEKKMFGGLAFMVRGKMCVNVGQSRLMCRIDPAGHDAALQHEGCTTVIMKGRKCRGYVHVDAEAVKIERELNFWVALSLNYNEKLQASSQKQT